MVKSVNELSRQLSSQVDVCISQARINKDVPGSPVAATIGFFRVSAMGVLEAQVPGGAEGDTWYPVSDDPDN